MKKHVFLGDTTIFVTAKTRGIDADREKEKCVSTLNSSNYATMHQEKNLQDRLKSAILDKMINILTKFRLYEQFQKNPCSCEWDEAFAVVYSKIPHTIIAYKLEQNDLPHSRFARIPVNLSTLWKKKSPVANLKGSRTPS